MKSFLANYIIIPKYGTVREKVFMTRIALGLTAIIFCMAALTYSAYAFFSHGVTSNPSKITAANYELNYTVTVGDNRPQEGAVIANEPEAIAPSDLDGTYKLPAGTYTIAMTKPETAKASTGFCKIEVCDTTGNSSLHYTQQIGKVSATDSVTTRYILVEVKVGTAFVKLTASWGTCARTDLILQDGQFEFAAVDKTTSNSNPTDTSNDTNGDTTQDEGQTDAPSNENEAPSTEPDGEQEVTEPSTETEEPIEQ